MAVIIPCAGQSSRYPGTRPKYLLTLADGKCLFEKAADPYLSTGVDVHFVVLKEHVEKYDAYEAILRAYPYKPNVRIHVLDEPTSGPAETVYSVAKDLGDQSIFIQDCDSHFTITGVFGLLSSFLTNQSSENFVCVADLRDNLNVTNVAAKSFAVLNDQDILTNIVEKSVVSNYICVGGYGFRSAREFCNSYDQLIGTGNEIFVSHVMKQMLSDDVFIGLKVRDYHDIGTYSEFVEYNKQRSTFFCDIDGTVFYNQSKLFSNHYGNTPKPIPNAVKHLLKKQEEGATIIFTTSRPEKFHQITESALDECGFKDYRVLYDIPHAPRVLINDTSKTNPYPSATAINVPRDDDDYWGKL